MNSRERFLAACARQPCDRPPVWLMRQAGRYLPEYRALKERHGFLKMVRTPDLAAEVSLQPLRRFPLDAAIIFSDILEIPAALGQPYKFREQGGIALEYALNKPALIEKWDTTGFAGRLTHVADAIRLLRREVGENTAVIGFAGAPWTLAAYMAEGGSPSEHSAIARLAQTEPAFFARLMEILSKAVAESLRIQIEAGADAIQIFDTWAGLCPEEKYEECSLRWVREVIAALPRETPVIYFAKTMARYSSEQLASGARVLSLDTSVDIAAFRSEHPGAVTQGNLDPLLIEGEPEFVRTATRQLLRDASGLGHIVNLGHGLTPKARIESVAAMVETVVAPASDKFPAK